VVSVTLRASTRFRLGNRAPARLPKAMDSQRRSLRSGSGWEAGRRTPLPDRCGSLSCLAVNVPMFVRSCGVPVRRQGQTTARRERADTRRRAE